LRGCATRSPKKTDAVMADDISPSSPFGLCRARFALRVFAWLRHA